jgi:hypothetical protein
MPDVHVACDSTIRQCDYDFQHRVVTEIRIPGTRTDIDILEKIL